jgi:hypothetical protein
MNGPDDLPEFVENAESVTFGTISTDSVEARELWAAFVAGFKRSSEGYNAEHPFAHDDGEIQDAIREDFEDWFTDYLSGDE